MKRILAVAGLVAACVSGNVFAAADGSGGDAAVGFSDRRGGEKISEAEAIRLTIDSAGGATILVPRWFCTYFLSITNEEIIENGRTTLPELELALKKGCYFFNLMKREDMRVIVQQVSTVMFPIHFFKKHFLKHKSWGPWFALNEQARVGIATEELMTEMRKLIFLEIRDNAEGTVRDCIDEALRTYAGGFTPSDTEVAAYSLAIQAVLGYRVDKRAQAAAAAV